jgi:hypothetical protein
VLKNDLAGRSHEPDVYLPVEKPVFMDLVPPLQPDDVLVFVDYL